VKFCIIAVSLSIVTQSLNASVTCFKYCA